MKAQFLVPVTFGVMALCGTSVAQDAAAEQAAFEKKWKETYNRIVELYPSASDQSSLLTKKAGELQLAFEQAKSPIYVAPESVAFYYLMAAADLGLAPTNSVIVSSKDDAELAQTRINLHAMRLEKEKLEVYVKNLEKRLENPEKKGAVQSELEAELQKTSNENTQLKSLYSDLYNRYQRLVEAWNNQQQSLASSNQRPAAYPYQNRYLNGQAQREREMESNSPQMPATYEVDHRAGIITGSDGSMMNIDRQGSQTIITPLAPGIR